MSVQAATDASVDLYWLPLGAGDQCVRWSGGLYEKFVAHADALESHRSSYEWSHG